MYKLQAIKTSRRKREEKPSSSVIVVIIVPHCCCQSFDIGPSSSRVGLGDEAIHQGLPIFPIFRKKRSDSDSPFEGEEGGEKQRSTLPLLRFLTRTNETIGYDRGPSGVLMTVRCGEGWGELEMNPSARPYPILIGGGAEATYLPEERYSSCWLLVHVVVSSRRAREWSLVFGDG